jgi:tight adherence protein B
MIVLITITGAIFVYALVRMLLPASGSEIITARFSKYLATGSMEDIQDKVLEERAAKDKRFKLNIEFISSEFADTIAASGIKLTPSEFVCAWLAATFIPMLLVAVINGQILSVCAAGIIGLAMPVFLLKRATKKRKELFTKQLGEALVIMGNSLKGGFSFQQAMDSLASEMAPPLCDEFAKAMREINYGLPLEEALQHMANRVKNQDLELFVSAVFISAQVGSNLTEILDTISGTIKDRIRIKQEVKVLTSSGRISGIIIGLLPVFLILLLMLINPGYFGSFLDSGIGKILLGVAVLMEVTGFSVIMKICDIQY